MYDAGFGIELGLLGLDPAPLSIFDGTKENKWVKELVGSLILYALMIEMMDEGVQFLSQTYVCNNA